MEEIHNYPFDPVIKFKQQGRSFSYKIIKEGTYPNKESLVYTLPPNKYRIPNNYIVETTWGRSTNQCTVQCHINYNDGKPIFQVWFGKCFEYRVSSVKTATDASNLFHKHYTSQKGTKTSGIYLFGLQLKILDKTRDRKRCAHVLKQVNQCSNTTLTRCATSIGKQLLTEFNEKVPKFYNVEEIPVLENIQIESVVRALDEGNISRNPYRRLCAIESHLPREGVVSKERQRINKEMAQLIPISIVDINAQVDLSEDEDIEDENIAQEIIDAVGKGGHRNIKDILRYLVPDLIQKRILNPHHPVINLRISGDGHNVGRKIKHVMITMAILDDKDTLHKPNSYHTIILYPGCENYDSLSNIMVPFCHDLRNLKEQGLIINNIRWNFQFCFSSDWKFLATCLGFNGAHSKNFCPWCTISKSQQGDLSKEWSISKNINKLVEKNNYYEGHTRKPLFDMIPLDHWIPDELHIMLRITDRLWSLLIAELMEQNLFNDTARKIIIDEMKRIKINFQFWQDHGSKTWNYTSLMGNDKVKVLQFFDLTKILSMRRATIVRDLWNKFYELYIKMKDPTVKAEDFKNDAINWLTLFLTPSEGIPNTQGFKKGLYQPDNITPYIHVLVFHISEFMAIHQKWGLKAFSCSGVEKKNHEQVSYFFCKTMKDGGGKKNSQSSAIVEILQNENRTLFYNHNNIPLNYQNPKTIHIKTQNI
ncbi:hypothetical protein GLOIN_2v1783827 [Rhizophagus irregularis DAOM 181602=DAOM 197198]|uniref:Transposase domain-containing protein n=1 Tax=Rhizophagus irregularis (strain DAOM 181602 / DAOM 197198 / MUCL 43194) TaxID=747089 RepID=A0A2H5U016_RHIID|nr:hypothetical protein GLOIN_2v1783827 [Rhizophagus irregularis DAOM 181602=DAOM 197198]POG63619.1 hypothetical protein GLOIN_2v1783827 [Rhizophagus irregularis DAOM 181602=DAOM 197198]GBC48166.1 hypothetical protein GLOIN_2v1783827 [Rhizophagus irregularis DAOM 181602=DAOM 197198]|eukprot:XP_025170485.1 hypothetical protein GLOIN_2v1783827 [Rhizophagus irregularis DAOM 181602=DAOM 197198]